MWLVREEWGMLAVVPVVAAVHAWSWYRRWIYWGNVFESRVQILPQHIRLFFAYTRGMQVIGNERRPDWPKLGPALMIATALIVAIRTARWAAKSVGGAEYADVDVELDKEVSFAVRISVRVMHELVRTHASLFPEKVHPVYAPDEDSPG